MLQRRQGSGDAVLDRDGRIIPESTMFLGELYETCQSLHTYRQYRSQVLLFERFRAAYDRGRGMPYDEVDDGFLKDLRSYRLKTVKIGTFLSAAFLWFRMFEFIQGKRWSKNLIGPGGPDSAYRIKIPATGYFSHPFLKGSRVVTMPKLPPHTDLDIIDEQLMGLITSDDIKEQWAIVLKTMRRLPLRRSEAMGLKIGQIPSRSELRRTRKLLERDSKALGINIPVQRAKRGGIRDAFFPLTLLEEYRSFIDIVRPKFLREEKSCDAVFVSTKTGLALNPQSLTNLYKLAAKEAAKITPRKTGAYQLSKARPHILRHRAVTDYARNYLEEGMEPDRVLLTIMDVCGVRNIETAAHYVHTAEDELQAESEGFIKATNKIEEKAASRLVNVVRTARRFRRRRRG